MRPRTDAARRVTGDAPARKRASATHAPPARAAFRRWAPLAAWALLAASSLAQPNPITAFQVAIDGKQPATPTASPGEGDGVITFDPATDAIRYEVAIDGLVGTFVALELRRGAAGEDGLPVQTLLGSPPPLLAGTSAPLGPADVDLLQRGDLYLNVVTSAFPSGELRGQITSARDQWAAYLEPWKVVPPSASPGQGHAALELDAASATLGVAGAVTGLAGTPSALQIRRGGPLENGPLLFSLPLSGQGAFRTSFGPLDAHEIAEIRSGDWYMEVVADSNAAALRGSIATSFLEYDDGCPGPVGPLRVRASGCPTPGGTFHGQIEGGGPGHSAIVFKSLTAAAHPVGYGCSLFLGLPLAPPVVAAFDANGEIIADKTLLPDIPTPCRLQVQVFAIDPSGGPGGVYASNGLSIHIDA